MYFVLLRIICLFASNKSAITLSRFLKETICFENVSGMWGFLCTYIGITKVNVWLWCVKLLRLMFYVCEAGGVLCVISMITVLCVRDGWGLSVCWFNSINQRYHYNSKGKCFDFPFQYLLLKSKENLVLMCFQCASTYFFYVYWLTPFCLYMMKVALQ